MRQMAVFGAVKTRWSAVKCGIKFGTKFGDSLRKLLELIFQNGNITAEYIAIKINLSLRAVEKQLANLKKQDL